MNILLDVRSGNKILARIFRDYNSKHVLSVESSFLNYQALSVELLLHKALTNLFVYVYFCVQFNDAVIKTVRGSAWPKTDCLAKFIVQDKSRDTYLQGVFLGPLQ